MKEIRLPRSVSRSDEQFLSGGMIVLALALLSVTLILSTRYEPQRLRMPDPFGYELAIQEFAAGRWALNGDEMAAATNRGRQEEGRGNMYVPVGPDRWAFRLSPGYPLTVIPFQWLGIPRLTNIMLALPALYFLYRYLAIRYDPRTAVLAGGVFLFSPITLLAMHYATMDTFAAGALLVIAGSLVMRYELLDGAGQYSSRFLFLAGLAGGWAVVVRLPSLPILLILILFVFFQTRKRPNQPEGIPSSRYHFVSFMLGVLVALSILLLYNREAFGRFLDAGYRYPSNFLYHPIWQAEPVTKVAGMETWLADGTVGSLLHAVALHAVWWLEPLLRGWPFMPLALAAIGYLAWHRRLGWNQLFLLAWLAATCFLYIGVIDFGATRLLMVPFYRTTGFFAVTRYLYPAVFPITLLTVEALRRMPARVADGLLLGLVAGSAVWFLAFVS